eukprot:3195846-Rhodomonas_salina.1
MKQPAASLWRMLLSSAVCLLLLQGALGYTAVVSGGSVNPDRSVQPTSSAAPENWARRTRDVVFFIHLFPRTHITCAQHV